MSSTDQQPSTILLMFTAVTSLPVWSPSQVSDLHV
jgi:hypothetical protein